MRVGSIKKNENNAKMYENNAKMYENNAKMYENNASMNENNANMNEKKAKMNEKNAKMNENDDKMNGNDNNIGSNKENELDDLNKPFPKWLMLLIPFYTLFFMALFIFPFAGDLNWLSAWIYCLSLSLIIGITYYKINLVNPRVLRNRMKLKKQGLTKLIEKAASSDKFILPLLVVAMLGIYVIPALEYRFKSPTRFSVLSIPGLVLSMIGLIIMQYAQLQNAFASKILDINKGQKLIDTGLYARVRHPLYSGSVIMFGFTPLALESLLGLIGVVLFIILIAVRIRYEEEMLEKGMDGYAEYKERVKYRLFPGIY